MEAVGVLHDEFAHAHQAATGAGFVPELQLELPDHEWQLLVGGEHVARQIRDGLFVGHGEHHVVFGAILEPQQFGADGAVAAGFHPQFGGLHQGQIDFLALDLFHLVPDDLLDLVENALAQGQHRVEAGGQLFDVAAAQQEDMAGQFGPGRRFPQRFQEIL